MFKKIIVGMALFCCLFFIPATTSEAKETPTREIQEEVVEQNDLSVERDRIISTALSLEGKIPYEWGGKPVSDGWNKRWNKHNGLDCSGYVQWVYWTAIGMEGGLESTYAISSSCQRINKNELQPGDLGLIFIGGSTEGRTNHVGIYLGENKWIHCSKGSNTVVVEEDITYFRYFMRVDFKETSKEEYQEMLKVVDKRIKVLNETIKEIKGDDKNLSEEEKIEEIIRELIWEKQKNYMKAQKETITLFGIDMFRKNK